MGLVISQKGDGLLGNDGCCAGMSGAAEQSICDYDADRAYKTGITGWDDQVPVPFRGWKSDRDCIDEA
ncbi:hypothetical protein D3C80_1094900 [compost metagenome]